jgi:CRISPR/Cas system-associated protein Cas5 (RAMP superfamily)
MQDQKAMKQKLKELEKRRDQLLEELRNLKRRYEKKELSKEEYEIKRHGVEREIVEVMDRMVQIQFLLSGGP